MIKGLSQNSGAAMLLIIIVITAIVLFIGLSIAFLGLGELELATHDKGADESFAIADGCTDEVLYRIRKNNNYQLGAGLFTLTLGVNTCEVDITGSASTRTVILRGIKGNYSKKLQITLTIIGKKLRIDTWEELTT